MNKTKQKQKPAKPAKLRQIFKPIKRRQRYNYVTDEIFKEVCAYLSIGMSVVEICKLDGMPNAHSIWRKIAENDIFKSNYLRAREMGMLAFAEDIVRIADNIKGDTQRDKLRIDTRWRLMGSYARPLFGDNIQVEGNPNKPIVIKWRGDDPNDPMVQGDSAKVIDGSVNTNVIEHEIKNK
jgi:hypothetical protein